MRQFYESNRYEKCTGCNRPVLSGDRCKRFRVHIRTNSQTGAVEGKTITEQAEQVMKNLKAVLEAAGSDFTKAVKTLCFLKTMNDFAAFNEVYAKYFTGKPARSCVAVVELPKGVLVEVEVVAQAAS